MIGIRSKQYVMKAWVLVMSLMLIASTSRAANELKPDTRQTLVDALMKGLREGQGFVSVHAAEDLIQLGMMDEPRAQFAPQAETAAPPFRIGVWRVMARSAATEAERSAFVERIRQVMLKEDSPDHTHSVEAMSKLSAPITSDAERAMVNQIAFGATNVAPFAAWRLTQADATRSKGIDRLVELLGSSDPISRARAADALAHLHIDSDSVHAALEADLKTEPADSLARPAVIAAIGGAPVRKLAEDSADPAVQYTMIMQLSRTGTAEDAPLLWKCFASSNLDVRAASAFALLRILDQQPTTAVRKHN